MIDDHKQKQNYNERGNNYKEWLEHGERLLVSHSILYDQYKIGWNQINSLIRKNGSATVKDFEENGLFQDYEDSKLLWVALMLLSFGAECILKSLWLKKGNSLAVNGFYIGITDSKDRKEKSHDLVYLCKMNDIALSVEEENVLMRLGKVSKSIGRYPISLKWEYDRIKETPIGTVSDFYWGHGDDVIIDGFLMKVKNNIILQKNN